MTILVDIALIGWVPAILLIFSLLPPRRAVIAAFLAGWCLLPIYGYSIQGMPEYNKQSATCVGILLATIVFDGARLFKFKPQLLDVPMALWCIAPLISNTLSEGGPYQGMSISVQYIFAWGIPYFIGRLYITDLQAMRDLALGLFIAGLVYCIFCLYEIKMSPQLHRQVYGFFQHTDFTMTMRGGGWRPYVFMHHGLAVGLFMCTNAVVAVWMAKCKSVKSVLGAPAMLCAAGLFLVAVLCKSTGANVLMVLGLGALWASTILKMGWPVKLMIFVPVAYMVLRTIGGWDARELVELASLISADRSGSLDWRLASETYCWDLVRPQALFGFGVFKFAGLRFEGSDVAVTPDGMWLIALVANGLFGLFTFYASLLLPVIAFVRRIHPRHWGHPAVAPGMSIAVIVILFAVDNLFNAMPNPIFVLAAGGLVSAARTLPAAARSGRIRPSPADTQVGQAGTAA